MHQCYLSLRDPYALVLLNPVVQHALVLINPHPDKQQGPPIQALNGRVQHALKPEGFARSAGALNVEAETVAAFQEEARAALIFYTTQREK